ncbi:D-erythronate dehydrogenase [Aliihoeflea sp. PC F10.4]
MRILVLGGAGMIGRRLIDALVSNGELNGRKISAIHSFDVVEGTFSSPLVTSQAGDIADAATINGLVVERPDVIFHLASIVSGEAEIEFEKGYRINLDGMRNLLEAVRMAGDDYLPRLVFTSSIAVFGAPFEEPIRDSFFHAPLTSYGTQKAICELLLSDYSRMGFVDGVGIRLPTIVVRPGKPNKAASGFFSGIIREPLAGVEAILPVDDDVRHWVASPAAAVGFLLHAAVLDTAALGDRRSLTMPGLSITVGEMIETLRDIAGEETARLIRRQPDTAIKKIVAGWPRDFSAERAKAAGFVADADFGTIIRAHIADEYAQAERMKGDAA